MLRIAYRERPILRTSEPSGLDETPMITEANMFPAGMGLDAALKLLRQAYDCAEELRQSAWEFAVELESLRAAGCSQTDCRWLIRKGYVAHAAEITSPAGKERRFRAIPSLSLPSRTCFVLTPAGAEFYDKTFASSRQDHSPATPLLRNPDEETSTRVPQIPVANYTNVYTRVVPGIVNSRRTTNGTARSRCCRVPIWDPELHELRLGRIVVKRFIRPAPAQELILKVFAEEGWPATIEDPLPALHGIDLKRRLHHTIRNLNRAQRPHIIHFSINGQGKRIRWCLRPTAAGKRQAARMKAM